jgi:hypothetical protein
MLIWPTPRSNDSSIKTGPCGTYGPNTGPRTELVAGSRIEVQFGETINHSGWFKISFAQVADQNYTIVEDQIPHSDAPPQPSFAQPRMYRHTITVPNVPCERCGLQLIQVMTDRNPPTNYYSCADIRIVAAPAPDAGVPPIDAGRIDAGFIDAGFVDAGFVDAGTPPPSRDAGSTPPPADAGSQPPPIDAGFEPEIDAGFEPPPSRDSGISSVSEDSGAARSGLQPDPMRGGTLQGGCACARSSANLSLLAILPALSLFFARRRRTA